LASSSVLDLPQCTAQFLAAHTHPGTFWHPAWLLSTLNNEAIFALNSHTQPITSDFSLELRLGDLKMEMEMVAEKGKGKWAQTKRSIALSWLTMPKR